MATRTNEIKEKTKEHSTQLKLDSTYGLSSGDTIKIERTLLTVCTVDDGNTITVARYKG